MQAEKKTEMTSICSADDPPTNIMDLPALPLLEVVAAAVDPEVLVAWPDPFPVVSEADSFL